MHMIPYADFAVFWPHVARLAKKLSKVGFAIQMDGSWKHVELAGPPDFATWWRRYRPIKVL